MTELRQETEENSQYIREKGFNLVEIYECQWRRMKRSNPDIQHFLTSEFHHPLDKQKTLNKVQIIQAVIMKAPCLGAWSVTSGSPTILSQNLVKCVPYSRT